MSAVNAVRPKQIQRLAYSKAEAASSLGISVDSLEEHVLPHLRVCRTGRLVLIPVTELERWLDRSAGSLWASA
jgi:excisionase family DNA binding protein